MVAVDRPGYGAIGEAAWATDSMRQSIARGTPQGQSQWIANLIATHGLESTVPPTGRLRKPTPNG
jgi:hypothetical protein